MLLTSDTKMHPFIIAPPLSRADADKTWSDRCNDLFRAVER